MEKKREPFFTREREARTPAEKQKTRNKIRKHLESIEIWYMSNIYELSRDSETERTVNRTTDWRQSTTNDIETTTKFLNHEINSFDLLRE